MKRRSLLMPALLAVLLPLALRAEQRVEGIAAVVDDSVILLSEVDAASAPILQEMKQRNGGAVPSEIRREVRAQAVDNLIAERLLVDMGERMGLEATDEDIDQAVSGIAMQEGIESEDVYRAAAAQGLSREAYRAQLSEQITRMKVVSQAVRTRITVTQAEVQELYDTRYGDTRPGLRADVRHILIPWPSPESGYERDAAREIVGKIMRAVEEGQSFAMLAGQFSAAPSAADGGRTTIRQGETNPDLERVAFSLEPGQIGPPIETGHGINLIQLLDRYDPASVTLADVEGELRREIAERKMGPEIDEWVAELRKQVYVEVVAPDLQ